MRKVHTLKTEKPDTRALSAEEIDCVVGGVMMRPDGTTCTGVKVRWPFPSPSTGPVY